MYLSFSLFYFINMSLVNVSMFNKKKHNFTFIRNIMEIGYKIKLEKSTKYHKLDNEKR